MEKDKKPNKIHQIGFQLITPLKCSLCGSDLAALQVWEVRTPLSERIKFVAAVSCVTPYCTNRDTPQAGVADNAIDAANSAFETYRDRKSYEVLRDTSSFEGVKKEEGKD